MTALGRRLSQKVNNSAVAFVSTNYVERGHEDVFRQSGATECNGWARFWAIHTNVVLDNDDECINLYASLRMHAFDPCNWISLDTQRCSVHSYPTSYLRFI